MPSVLAIISKAVFEKLTANNVTIGACLSLDRYVSSHAAFQNLGADDAIFVVTVRPPKEALWLVGIVEGPKRVKDAWVGAKNTTPIADVSSAIKKLAFTTGAGIKAKKGALGMSLQTPRVLTDADITLLRRFAPSSAVAAYRAAVDETPAAKRASAEASTAAASGATLRFDNYRKPFEMLGKLAPPQRKQLEQLTKNNRAGKPEDCVDDENWAPMELVDVVEIASGAVKYQFYLFPWGSGHVFEHDNTTTVATIIQHSFDFGIRDLELRRALAAAYATANPKLKELVDFQLDYVPEPRKEEEIDAQKRLADGMKRIGKELGKSKERYRLFEDLSKAQQAMVREVFGPIKEGVWRGALESFGLPPLAALRRCAGLDPSTLLERRVGRWPAWKWLKAATLEDIEPEEAIDALTGELAADVVSELVWLVSTEHEGYDFFGASLQDQRGESQANRFTQSVVRLLASLVDASGPDAAIAFAERVQKEAPAWVEAIATFALAARARRRGEPFPTRFLELAAKADSLGWGRHLNESMREVVELIPMEQREAFLDAYAPSFDESYDTEYKKGREIEVPCLLHRWFFADLIPSDATAETVVLVIEEWDDEPKPKEKAIDVLCALGPICVPHLKKVIKRTKSPHKSVLVAALKRLE